MIARSLSSASSPLVQNLVKAGLPGKVVAGVMAVGGTLLQYGQGKITTAECITSWGTPAVLPYGPAMPQLPVRP